MPHELAALEKLPSRPLSVAEGRTLSDQESESSWIRPESVVLREGDEVVVALMAVNRDSGHAWLLGYSPESERWIVVEDWEEKELDKSDFYELLEEWERDTFGGREEWMIGPG